jgi:hypothetical protein
MSLTDYQFNALVASKGIEDEVRAANKANKKGRGFNVNK